MDKTLLQALGSRYPSNNFCYLKMPKTTVVRGGLYECK